MQPPVIFLIGPPTHGKTAARHIVCKLTGLKGASCSDIIAAFIAERSKTTYEAVMLIPKEERRPLFIEAGDWLCGMDGPLKEVAKDPSVDESAFRIPSALVRALYLGGYHVIDGARRALELDQARAHLQWLGVRSLAIWVEKPDAAAPKDNTTVKKEQADEVIENNGTLDELESKLHVVLLKHFPPAKKAPAPPAAFEQPALILNSKGEDAGLSAGPVELK